MLPPAGMIHFLYVNFLFFLPPPVIPSGYQKDIGAGFPWESSRPWALPYTTSIPHNIPQQRFTLLLVGTLPKHNFQIHVGVGAFA
jgi:hypothetical protein